MGCVDLEAGAPGGRELDQVGGLLEIAVLDSPEHGKQRGRARLEQRRDIDVMRTEANPERPEAGPRFLVERLHLLGDLGPFDDAQILDQPEGDAPRLGRQCLGRAEVDQRLQESLDAAGEPEIDAGLDALARAGGKHVVGKQDQPRLQHVVAFGDPGDHRAAPAQRTIGSEHEIGVGRGRDLLGPVGDLAGQRLRRGGPQRLDVGSVGAGIRLEAEARQAADMLPLDQDVAGRRDLRFEHRFLFQPPHQDAGAAIDETCRQPLVERVRKTILYSARPLLPMHRIVEPVRPIGDECPGPDVGDAVGERVDVAVGAVGIGDLPVEPVVRNAARAGEEGEQRLDQLGMVGRRDLAIIRHLAGFPEPHDEVARRGHPNHLGVARQGRQRLDVDRRRRLGQALHRRRPVEAFLQRLDGREVEVAVPPLDGLHRLELVGLQRPDQLVVERIDPAGDTESAVAHVAAGAPGNLAELGGGQLAELEAVEFPVGGEGDMVEVEVEAHADRVGGDEEIDVAGLEQFDLGVPGARRERAEHHRRAAALAADQFGDGVDLVGRERDRRRAARQARDLLRAGP